MSRPSPLIRVVPALALLFSVLVCFASLLTTVSAQAAEELPDDAKLLKMKVKDLKAYLEKKGPEAACLACTSKQEYVSRIHETLDWPDVTPPPEPSPAADELSMEDVQKMFAEGQNDQRIVELKKKLEEAGIDTSKMFTSSGLNREQIVKEKEKWEKLRDDLAKETGDGDGGDGGVDDGDGAKDESDASKDEEAKGDL